MNKDEALKLAKECGATTYTNRHYPEATAVTFSPVAWEKFCEQALAAPVQEPVAWIWKYANGEEEVVFAPPRHVDASYVDAPSTITPLYTTPPAQRQWVGLTDEEIKGSDWVLSAVKEYEAYTLQEELVIEGVAEFAHAIEAKLKEKNNG
jgi:hypothetical protein